MLLLLLLLLLVLRSLMAVAIIVEGVLDSVTTPAY
jgi:hypothetical protein